MESPIKSILHKINTFLAKIETWFLCLTVAMIIGLALLEIVMRYGFRTSVLWKTIMLQNLTLWLCFLGAALASSEKRHISIDVFNRFLPKSIINYSSYIIDVVSLIVVGILAYYGFHFVLNEQQSAATLIGSIPLWWAKTIIPIGFVLIGFHIVLQMCINLTEIGHIPTDVEGESD